MDKDQTWETLGVAILNFWKLCFPYVSFFVLLIAHAHLKENEENSERKASYASAIEKIINKSQNRTCEKHQAAESASGKHPLEEK